MMDRDSERKYFKTTMTFTFEQYTKLRHALQEAGNANGTPIPAYYGAETQIELYQERAAKVAEIIGEALSHERA